MGAYDLTLGSLSIGTNLNFFLFGLVVYQFAYYYDASYQDNRLIRSLVAWLLFIDTFHTALCGYCLWDFTIAHFNDAEYAFSVNWSYLISPALIAMTSTPVQLYLARRVYLLCQKKLLFALTALLAIVQGLAAIGTTIGAFMVHDLLKLQLLAPIVLVWFPVQIMCDLMITSSLVWALTRNKTRDSTTKSDLVKYIVQASVETALFATVFATFDMVFFALPGTNVHVIFAFTMGRIYSNTILGTLNARPSPRELLSERSYQMTVPSSSASGPAHRNQVGLPTQTNQAITISVHHVIESTTVDGDYDEGSSDKFDRENFPCSTV